MVMIMMSRIRSPSLHPFLAVIPLLRKALLHVLVEVGHPVKMGLMDMLMLLIQLISLLPG